MGNDISCKIEGIGTIKIKMLDGTFQALTEVPHVPELSKNMISLGCLDAIDCKITLSGRVMKIVKNVMVILKGLKSQNLYRLQGTTIIGGATILSQSDGNNDNAIL